MKLGTYKGRRRSYRIWKVRAFSSPKWLPWLTKRFRTVSQLLYKGDATNPDETGSGGRPRHWLVVCKNLAWTLQLTELWSFF